MDVKLVLYKHVENGLSLPGIPAMLAVIQVFILRVTNQKR